MGASLAVASIVWGLLTWWVFRRFTNQAALRRTGKCLYARLLEIRLYSDEPALVWRAQKALIADNGSFLAIIAKPVLIVTLLFALLYLPLDAIYGRDPLAPGQSVLVTTHLGRDLRESDANAMIAAPPGIVVETSPVRNFADRQISWRIRAESPVQGDLRVEIPGDGEVIGAIGAGAVMPFARPLIWMEVESPRASYSLGGLQWPWLAWFVFASTVVAGALTALAPGRRGFRGLTHAN